MGKHMVVDISELNRDEPSAGKQKEKEKSVSEFS